MVRYSTATNSRLPASAKAEQLPFSECDQLQATVLIYVNMEPQVLQSPTPRDPHRERRLATSTESRSLSPPIPPFSTQFAQKFRTLRTRPCTRRGHHTAEAPPDARKKLQAKPARQKEDKKQINEREAAHHDRKAVPRVFRKGEAVPFQGKTYPLDCLTSHCKTWSMLTTCEWFRTTAGGKCKSSKFSKRRATDEATRQIEQGHTDTANRKKNAWRGLVGRERFSRGSRQVPTKTLPEYTL